MALPTQVTLVYTANIFGPFGAPTVDPPNPLGLEQMMNVTLASASYAAGLVTIVYNLNQPQTAFTNLSVEKGQLPSPFDGDPTINSFQPWVCSTSNADTAGGTGARTIRVQWRTGAHTFAHEDVTLNGRTMVQMNTSFTFGSSIFGPLWPNILGSILTAGSAQANVGKILFFQRSTASTLLSTTVVPLQALPANAVYQSQLLGSMPESFYQRFPKPGTSNAAWSKLFLNWATASLQTVWGPVNVQAPVFT